MPTKRKMIAITIGEMLKTINRVRMGALLRIVATDLNVGTSTASDWIKSKVLTIF